MISGGFASVGLRAARRPSSDAESSSTMAGHYALGTSNAAPCIGMRRRPAGLAAPNPPGTTKRWRGGHGPSLAAPREGHHRAADSASTFVE